MQIPESKFKMCLQGHIFTIILLMPLAMKLEMEVTTIAPSTPTTDKNVKIDAFNDDYLEAFEDEQKEIIDPSRTGYLIF